MSTSLTLDNVSVEFPIYDASRRSLKRSLVAATTGGRFGLDASDRIVVRALNDINLSFQHGDRIALLGGNGAGKTTLLRIFAGVYEPVRGSVTRNGSVASLFDLSMGMDMEATGFENIRLRGMLLGMSAAEIEQRHDQVVQFTELGDFLNFPIRTYSSGMLMRLSFSIATCIKPDIILMDEWISVGDGGFVAKAEERLRDLVSSSGILVLASHSLELATDICNKAVLLAAGRVVTSGPINDVVDLYSRGGSDPDRAVPADAPIPT